MKENGQQYRLFDEHNTLFSLPADYEPFRPDHLRVSRIYLTGGSTSTPERRHFVERICALYPEVPVIDRTGIPHNQIKLDETDELALHQAGKHTLVFGELKTAVRFSNEEGNACPNYWHFSPCGFCPHDCTYCYLAGTPGVKFSPTIKIYVNLPEMITEIDRIATRLHEPTAFYLGKLQDSLALDPLTAYSSVLVPFFAGHPYARMTLLTKSVHVEGLSGLSHQGHTILSWSVNPPEVCVAFENNVPNIEDRMQAMCRMTDEGYPVRAIMMPVIPVENWKELYTVFTKRLLREVPVQRLTLGGICIYRGARQLMEIKMGTDNAVSTHIETTSGKKADGRRRYPAALRTDIYSTIISTARSVRPELDIALCLEEHELWQETGLIDNIGRCNCVL
ncbi:MAG: hypothetical protein JW712_00545 [Dehalococcoidales bacterium]|nr:hypothetical protein [Dehalococcoidales bacterium]